MGATFNITGDLHIEKQISISGGVVQFVDHHTPAIEKNKEYTVLPRPDDYEQLVAWLASEKKNGRDWYALAGNNRSAMCRQLSELLGWTVDQNSLRKAQNR